VAVDRRKGVRDLFRPVNGIIVVVVVVAVEPAPRLVRVLSKVLARCQYLVRLPLRIIEQGEGAPDYVLKIAGRREETVSRAVKWAWSGCRSLVSALLPPSVPPRTSYFPWWIWNRHQDLPSRQPLSRRPQSPSGVWCHLTHISHSGSDAARFGTTMYSFASYSYWQPGATHAAGSNRTTLPENDVNDVPLHFWLPLPWLGGSCHWRWHRSEGLSWRGGCNTNDRSIKIEDYQIFCSNYWWCVSRLGNVLRPWDRQERRGCYFTSRWLRTLDCIP
jgi:hypothetical protein